MGRIRADGSSEQRTVPEIELPAVLRDTFGIALAPEEVTALTGRV